MKIARKFSLIFGGLVLLGTSSLSVAAVVAFSHKIRLILLEGARSQLQVAEQIQDISRQMEADFSRFVTCEEP